MRDYLPANFNFWDSVNIFDFDEASWLWCGLEPPGGENPVLAFHHAIHGHQVSQSRPVLPAMGQRIYNLILAEMKNPERKLNLVNESGMPGLTRDQLRNWASGFSYRPLFLFPELRPENQAGLSLDGALLVIAALSTALDKRWKPGASLPYGMAAKITAAANLIGLQLNRNTISKYLKEAGNKINSA